jgi:hypothetical protein
MEEERLEKERLERGRMVWKRLGVEKKKEDVEMEDEEGETHALPRLVPLDIHDSEGYQGGATRIRGKPVHDTYRPGHHRSEDLWGDGKVYIDKLRAKHEWKKVAKKQAGKSWKKEGRKYPKHKTEPLPYSFSKTGVKTKIMEGPRVKGDTESGMDCERTTDIHADWASTVRPPRRYDEFASTATSTSRPGGRYDPFASTEAGPSGTNTRHVHWLIPVVPYGARIPGTTIRRVRGDTPPRIVSDADWSTARSINDVD